MKRGWGSATSESSGKKDEVDRNKAAIRFVGEQSGDDVDYSEALVRSMIEKVTVLDDRMRPSLEFPVATECDLAEIMEKPKTFMQSHGGSCSP